MKFSARSQYALEAMLALAEAPEGEPIQVRSIADGHGIPIRFLEQIMAALKKSGLVKSIRGARGGYMLASTPGEIPVARILEAIEGPIEEGPQPTEDDSEPPAATRAVHGLWREAQEAVRGLFLSISLGELLTRKQKLEGSHGIMFHI
ncbi:MAG: Rrf2 family transcriptional regulator [Nitrospirota bacterium]|nr:Rrf2 family transcriptional regulator [Nitrospirota bacterium]